MAIDTIETFLLILVLLLPLRECLDDTLLMGESLLPYVLRRSTLSSQGDKFELGFFKRGNPSKIYLGIWYKGLESQRIVWVANRDNHLNNRSTIVLEFSDDGNLVLLQASSLLPIWSTNLKYLPSNSTEATLLDDGNFVLRDRSNRSTIFWESFDHPTDTWLPSAYLGISKVGKVPKRFISWRNSEDPSPGMFSFVLDQYKINGSIGFKLEWNRYEVYWSSGIPEYSFDHLIAITSSGQLQKVTKYSSLGPWIVDWSKPSSLSNVYALCGSFGIYDNNSANPCDCPKGFEPFSDTEARLNDWSNGCRRKHPLQCESRNGKMDWFLKISNVTLPFYSKAYLVANVSTCEIDCMNTCSCTAYAHNSNECMIWEGALLNLRLPSDGGEAGQDIYLRLSANERQSTKGNRWKVWVIVAVLVPATGLILCLSVCFSCKEKRKRKGKGDQASSNDLLLFDFSIELHAINDETNTKDNVTKSGKKDVELPLFSYESVLAATDNFSITNKLGEGGFGPVYKGKSLKGHEIAVKMLSKRSGQGLDEFMNETTLIAKLQHRNLVRLLGCCMEGDKKILIYEYMPNKSLDFYLFDQNKKKMLDWGTRIRIIGGIAQGLLYLHQYSRLRIIHRDMKPSNILLDSEMNPKISDFGMARIVGDNEAQANTNRVVGTYGYMSPEYAMQGLYSIKSDVFSFGVLLLEIVSGEKNTGFYNRDSLNLLSHAWELWREDRSLELADSMIGHPSSKSTVVRLINIGLLCVQESPSDRPTMLDVVSIIGNEHAPLPIPKKPAFTVDRNSIHSNPKFTHAENCSVNNVTISEMEVR